MIVTPLRSHRHAKQTGFTIVELLIVIVVIAILAAIVIVAYNGIRDQAVESVLKQDLRNAASQLEADKTINGTEEYADTLSDANGGVGIEASEDNAFQYTRTGSGTSMTFCISVSTTRSSSVYHFSSTEGTIEEGFCDGHSGAVVTTLAGSTSGYLDGTGTAARFALPADVAIDSSGNIYVAEQTNDRIRMVTPAGVVTTFAGSGVAGYNDATGTAAQFNNPQGIDIDTDGNLYVAEVGNDRIRKITPAGVVTTLAGSGVAGFNDATGTSAQFNNPSDIAVDSSGTLYVADSSNNRIRVVTSGGVVTTLAGDGTSGYAEGTGSAAHFNFPAGVDVDSSGNVYVADNANHRIRKITSGGVSSTLSGSGTEGYLDGAGATARFAWPEAVAVDSDGNVYVSDAYNGLIRLVTSTGVTSTVAGTQFAGGADDGTGTAAHFNYPWGLEVSSDGNTVFVADTWNHRIRKIDVTSL